MIIFRNALKRDWKMVDGHSFLLFRASYQLVARNLLLVIRPIKLSIA